ncbi:hypothetical protein F3Y22_tig00111917pilonHSYRG00002 [Hibiscus syriacus]|uniref:Uncharacterized protein n=1 Tax=Hibiscus syriacus TaxID=106335 RepID=A0A6A2YDM3_HIBSY|nr:hypothetical protein F3Y22_tig00111917pilonHSYRG00002 [Hibiscus syriacus]
MGLARIGEGHSEIHGGMTIAQQLGSDRNSDGGGAEAEKGHTAAGRGLGFETLIFVGAGGLPSAPNAVDNIVRDGRQNKKSKWDKVDTDRRNPLPAGGQHSLSAAGAHTVILSAANAVSGYTAFAQQKRLEAQEKKSSEKRLDRRS